MFYNKYNYTVISKYNASVLTMKVILLFKRFLQNTNNQTTGKIELLQFSSISI